MPEQQNPMFAAVRDFYAALNANDVAAALRLFDAQAVRIEFEGHPFTGTYRGLAELEAHLSAARSTWAEGSCEPLRMIAAGDKVVVPVHVRVRKKDSASWNEGETGDVFTFKDGKIVEFRTFLKGDEALAWAGATAS
ncbi:MAG TPA: nuclear transport factor 2 family protein [Candidatus Peribacteria bacterium]|nr:nuclear transport factor 2 family protein [Candidatus Peribacteria bacterium]